MKSKYTVRRHGKWSVKRRVNVYEKTIFTGFFSQCRRWARAFEKSFLRKNGMRPEVRVVADSSYKVSLRRNRAAAR